MYIFETKTYLYIEQMVEVQLGNCCLGYISLFLMLCRLNEQHSLCLYYNAIYLLSESPSYYSRLRLSVDSVFMSP